MGTLPSTISSNTTLTGTTGTPSGGTTLENVQLVNQGTLTDSTGITGGVGTVTNSNGATFIVADPLTVGAIDNEGTLTLSNGGAQQTTITANLLTNEGELQATFPGGGFASNVEIIDAVLVNSGTFAMTSGTGTVKLEAGGASTGSIGVAAGAILEFGSTGSVTYTMSGTYGSSGTTEIDLGATVSFTSGTTVDVSTGTAWDLGQPQFNSVEPGGTLDLSQAVVTGSFSNLAMNGVLLLGSNSVTVNGFSIAGEVSDSATLTLNGTVGSGEMLSGILTGGGTVVLQQGAQPSGAITLDGGETLTNEGTLAISTGGLGSDGNSGDTLDNASGATLALSGGSVTIDVARLVNSGTITVAASTLADIAVTTMTGSGGITVAAGGTLEITQGTIVGAIDGLNLQGSLILGSLPVTIDGFSLAGTAFLFDQATVTMGGSNGTLGGILTGGGTVVLSSGQSSTVTSVLALKIRETLENEGSLTVNADINGNTGSETLVNASGATLAFTGGAVSTKLVNVVNDGTIEVSGGTVSITTGTLSGGGAIVVTAGTLDLSQATITGSLGSLTDDGTLSLGANSVTFDGVSMAAGSALSDSATVTLIGGTDGGSLPYSTNAELGGTLSGGGTVVLGSFSQSYGVTSNLGLGLGTDQETLENEGSLVVAAQVVSGQYGTLVNSSGATLTLTGVPLLTSDLVALHLAQVENAGLMVVSAGSDAIITGGFTDTGTITVSSGATLDLSEGATVTSPLGNVNVAGTLLLGDSAVTINGLSLSGGEVDVAGGGSLSLQQAVTGTGTLTIGSGATLAVSTAISAGEVVQFDGTGGLLALAPGASFGGSISGFAAGDTIDLEGMAATMVSYAGGNLVVSDNGDTVATIALAGAYSPSQFAVEPDGAGGSDIVFNSNTYAGQIRFVGTGLSFDGLAFNTQFTANVTVAYLTSLTSSSADGTISYSASSYATNPDGTGAASSGFISGGSTAEALPPNSFTNPVLTVTASSSPISGGDDWIARNVLTLDISSGTSTTITGTAIDNIYDEFSNGTTLSTPFTLTRPTTTVASDFTGGGVSEILLRGTDGSVGIDLVSGGSLASAASLGNLSTAWDVVGVGDFNGDGTSDIVLQNASTGEVDLWLMNGGAVASDTMIATVPTTWSVAGVGDFSGDGDADLLWRNTATGEVDLWLMDGASVVSDTMIATVPTTWSVAGVGDFSGGGDADLLWRNTVTGEVDLWLMDGASVVSDTVVATVPTTWSVAGVGDFSGDGDADLLWQNAATGEVDLWLMNGASVVSDTDLGTMPAPWSVAEVGDFNGDGTSDILWRNQTTGAAVVWSMSGTTVLSSTDVGTIASSVAVVPTAPGTPTAGVAAGVFSDFNGDGTSDIVWRDGTTGATDLWLMSGGSVVSDSPIATVSTGWVVAGIGDLNGDGDADLLWRNTTTGETDAWLMNGASVISDTDLSTVPTAWAVVGMGSFNGNGDADILWRNTVTGETDLWLMNGTSVVSDTDLGIVPTTWTVAGTGDFNGDGDADILWRNTATGETDLWLMNGTSVVSDTDLGIVPTTWTVAGVGDFNGDGKADILWQNTVTGETDIWLMNGASIVSDTNIGTVPSPWAVADVGDYNGDGKADILWRNTTTGETDIWLMNGTGVVSDTNLATIATTWSPQKPVLAPH